MGRHPGTKDRMCKQTWTKPFPSLTPIWGDYDRSLFKTSWNDKNGPCILRFGSYENSSTVALLPEGCLRLALTQFPPIHAGLSPPIPLAPETHSRQLRCLLRGCSPTLDYRSWTRRSWHFNPWAIVQVSWGVNDDSKSHSDTMSIVGGQAVTVT